MEDKSLTGRRNRPRLVHPVEHAERDSSGPGLTDLQREVFEKRVQMNKDGHIDDIVRGH